MTDPANQKLGAYIVDVVRNANHVIYNWLHTEITDQPIIIFFHGNTAMKTINPRMISLAENGYFTKAIEYRGYSCVPGSPNEKDIVEDSVAFIDSISGGDSNRKIILYGHSLGTAVVMQVAARRPVSALILEAPMDSVESIAEDEHPLMKPFVPWVLRDKWDSIGVVSKITAPVLIMHGTDDQVVLYSKGKRLAEAFGDQAKFVSFPGAGHDLYPVGAMDEIYRYINNLSLR